MPQAYSLGSDGGPGDAGAGPCELEADRDALRVAGLLHRHELSRRTLSSRTPLGVAAMRLLWLLGDGGGRTLREIAAELKLEQSTANREVNAALVAGLVERRGARSNYHFSASPAGTAAFQATLALVTAAHGAALAAIDVAERRQFVTQLERFVQAFAETMADSSETD